MKHRFMAVTITILLIILTTLTVVGCTMDNTENNDNMTCIYDSVNNTVYDFTDPDTGVHYLIYRGYEKGGITPRYNADGTIMVDDRAD